MGQASGMPAPARDGARAGGDDRHEWNRMAGGWHLAFAVFAAATACFILADAGLSPARRTASLAILVAACGWYLAAGRRLLHTEVTQAGRVYIAVSIPLTIGLFAAVPFGALMLCLLYPHIWRLLPPRPAAAATVVTAAATAVAGVSWTGLGAEQVLSAAATAVASLLVATLVGLYVGRIARQSRSRAALITELAATRAELAEASRMAGATAERERLACDIHDTLTQGFASILLLLEAAETELGPGSERTLAHLRKARTTARENIAEARAMIAELRPPHLRHASLPEALRQITDGTGTGPGPRAHLTVTGQPRPLAADAEVVLLRATQEALANVRKHARASRAEVSLAYQQDAVTLQVSDDGRGFDPGESTAGFGLEGMRARAAQAGGVLLVHSAPGAGTTVRLDLPLTSATALSHVPPAQVPLSQVPPAQVPLSQVPLSQVPPAQVPPAQVPPGTSLGERAGR